MNSNNALGKQFEFDNNFYFHPVKMGPINLYQLGELGCEGGFRIESHLQICHEISYIISGEGKFFTDDVATDVSEGDIYLISKGHIHAIQSNRMNPLRYLYLAFDFNAIDNEKIAVLNNFFTNIVNPVVKDKNSIDSLFTKVINEFYNEGAFTSFMKESYIEQIMVLTYRNFFENKSKPFYLRINTDKSVGFTVYSIIRYVEDNVYQINSIKDIADKLGYSYGYISHLFKDKTGKTLQEYINIKKMSEAIKLIKEGRLNITQIAEKLNYETIQAFSKAFKKATGCSPANYVKLFK